MIEPRTRDSRDGWIRIKDGTFHASTRVAKYPTLLPRYLMNFRFKRYLIVVLICVLAVFYESEKYMLYLRVLTLGRRLK